MREGLQATFVLSGGLAAGWALGARPAQSAATARLKRPNSKRRIATSVIKS